MFHFYAPCKRHNTFGFPKFSGGREMDNGLKWVNNLKLATGFCCFVIFDQVIFDQIKNCENFKKVIIIHTNFFLEVAAVDCRLISMMPFLS